LLSTLRKKWQSANNIWRHLDGCSSNVLNNVEYVKPYLKHLSNCCTIVDWGPGGGFVCKSICDQLTSIHRVDFVDVCDDHFDSVRGTLSGIDQLNGHLFNGFDNLNITNNPDILIAFSVIYHMPSLEYVSNLLYYWNCVLKPRKILIRNMFSLGESWQRCDNYMLGNNYLRGNLFNFDEFMGLLSNYLVVDRNDICIRSHDGCPDHLDLSMLLSIAE
jgi:hypothetical protein